MIVIHIKCLPPFCWRSSREPKLGQNSVRVSINRRRPQFAIVRLVLSFDVDRRRRGYLARFEFVFLFGSFICQSIVCVHSFACLFVRLFVCSDISILQFGNSLARRSSSSRESGYCSSVGCWANRANHKRRDTRAPVSGVEKNNGLSSPAPAACLVYHFVRKRECCFS